MRYFFIFLLVFMVSANAYELHKESKSKKGARYSAELSAGLRNDNLKWNISGPITIGGVTNTPNVLSELEWKNMKSYYSKITLKGDEGRFALKLSFGYGKSFDGKVRDSDYFYSDRQGEFSRSSSDTTGSESYDYLAALGYKYDILEKYLFLFFLGYEQNVQKLKITNGNIEIPQGFGTISGLDSRYETKWRGVFVGGDFQFRPTVNSEFLMGYYYHWLNYEGKGYWNLRSDFAQSPSFKHTGNGNGYTLNFDYNYYFSDNWGLNLKGEYKDFKIKDGDDLTYFSDGSSSVTKLNEVKWDSYNIVAGVSYKF